MTSRRRGDDAGSVTILVVGFMLIVMLLIMVVVDVSRVFLVQRALGAAADGAAVSAAGALDEEAVYTGGLDQELPIDPVEAASRVVAYAAAADLAGQYEQFSVESVTVSGITVTVTLRAVVQLPFQAVAPGSWSEGVPVLVTASARSPVAG